MSIGSLFSGIGGLERGLERATGQQVAWQCEYDKDASKVLDGRWPGVANLHDVTAVDWADAEPVEIVCGGFPCQPFSSAGRRKGTTDDRWMWPEFARCVRALRPRYVVVENVSALLADAGAFGAVLGDLAEAGYDARWTCLRAADVGAPHRRERLFLVAEYAGHTAGGTQHWQQPQASSVGAGQSGEVGSPARTAGPAGRHEARLAVSGDATATDGERGAREPGGCHGSTADPEHGDDRWLHEGSAEEGRPDPGAPRQRTPASARHAATHTNGAGSEGQRHAQPAWRAIVGRDDATPSDANSAGGEAHSGRPGAGDVGRLQPVVGSGTAWGPYKSAIRRWELTHGPAPAPVDGRGRLSPAFVEWMMGFPPGWVTDAPISRSAQLRCLGNAVVPHCAEMAWHLLSGIR